MFLREANRLEEAAAACERAMGIGVKALPEDFTGRLEWSWLKNRPFLRAAMGLPLVRLDEGDRRAGIELLERILSWNPNDNQGVRLMIGSETTHRPAGGRGRVWGTTAREVRPQVRDREPVCESHDSTGEPGAGNRHAGFGERGEETRPRGSGLRPDAKAPDEPPTPYRLRASPRLYSRVDDWRGGGRRWG